MSKLPFTKKSFLQWLDEQPDNALAGVPQTSDRCIIARYMTKGLGLKNVHVNYLGISHKDSQGLMVRPDWVHRVMRTFDHDVEARLKVLRISDVRAKIKSAAKGW